MSALVFSCCAWLLSMHTRMAAPAEMQDDTIVSILFSFLGIIKAPFKGAKKHYMKLVGALIIGYSPLTSFHHIRTKHLPFFLFPTISNELAEKIAFFLFYKISITVI